MVNVNVNGRLGADAELKSGKNGEQFLVFRLATNEYNKNTKANESIWLNVIFFGRKAATMCPYLKKGSAVNIMGEERVSLYQLRSGEYIINRDIFADRVEFIGTSSGTDENTNTAKTRMGIPESQTTSFSQQNVVITDSQPTFSNPRNVSIPEPQATFSRGVNIPEPQATFSAPSASVNDNFDDLPF